MRWIACNKTTSRSPLWLVSAVMLCCLSSQCAAATTDKVTTKQHKASTATAATAAVEPCPLGDSYGDYTSATCQFYLGTKAYRHQRFTLAAAHWQEVLELPPTSAPALRASAQNTLGFLYFYGKGIKQNKAQGIRLWQAAAQQGAPEAFLHLGHAYQHADFYDRDPVTALAWYLAMQRKYPTIADINADDQAIWTEAQQQARQLASTLSASQRQLAAQRADTLLTAAVQANH